eukprot:COSAG02_NODE_4363_length_5449_cov_10.058692_2_plen_72_part_00
MNAAVVWASAAGGRSCDAVLCCGATEMLGRSASEYGWAQKTYVGAVLGEERQEVCTQSGQAHSIVSHSARQ